MRSFKLFSVKVGQVHIYEYIIVRNENYFNSKYHFIQSVVLRKTNLPHIYDIYCLLRYIIILFLIYTWCAHGQICLCKMSQNSNVAHLIFTGV